MKMTEEFRSRVLLTALASAGAIASIAIVWHARILILLLFAGCIFALVLQTLASGLQKIARVRYGIAYVLILIGIGMSLSALVWLRGPAVMEQVNELRTILPETIGRSIAEARGTGWGRWLVQINDDVQLSRGISFIVSKIGGAMTGTLSMLGGTLIVFLAGIYISAEPDHYTRGVRRLVPELYRQQFDACFQGAVRNLRYWLLARLLAMAIIGTLVSTGMWLLGIPLAGTLGLIAALLTFIPNLGPILSAVPAVFLAFSVSPSKAIFAILVICAAHFLEGNLVTPLVDRGIVKLPPALTLTTQCLLGAVTGPVGIALAAPMLAVILGIVHAIDAPQDDPGLALSQPSRRRAAPVPILSGADKGGFERRCS